MGREKILRSCSFFFFQAEDGIRDKLVTEFRRVLFRSQYCSRPALQLAHTRQESTKQPTPASSPTLNRFTWDPTRVTRPTISWPGTMGKIEPPHSSRA